MIVIIGGNRVRLTDADVLGVGGEGRVFRYGGLAAKIYHPTTGAPAEDAARALAFAKVSTFPRGLPREVVAPLALVTDTGGAPVGFTMPIVEGGVEAYRLGQRRFREGVVSAADVLAIFRRVRDVVAALHTRGVVVGDLNDGNVLVVGGEPRFIDADSMQFNGLPCIVGHERFLDPRLYGRDLAAAPSFTPASDWYALAVMLFSSLLYVHPYGGSHAAYPTALRRAEARHSVLRPDVIYPAAAVRADALPDAMLDWFGAVFDRDARAPVPDVLLAVRFTRCGCGVEHARRACPACTTVVAATATLVHGGLRAVRVFAAPANATIVAAAVQDKLRFLYDDGAGLVRENGTRLRDAARVAGGCARVAGDATWLGAGERLVRYEGSEERARLSTAAFQGSPAFDANVADAFRVADDWLLSATTGRRIGQVISGQTWLRVGATLGFGFYRTGAVTKYFVFATARGGLRTVDLPPLSGKLVDAAAYFDHDRVLFIATTEEGGRAHVVMHLIGGDGAALATMSGAPDAHVALRSPFGKCVAFGVVLVAHEAGLLAMTADPRTRTFVETRAFPDARGHVSEGCDLLPGPAGSLYVVSPREIMQLSL